MPYLLWVKDLLSTEFCCAKKRLLIRSGYVLTRVQELSLANVISVEVEQSLFGMLFDYGTIKLKSTDGKAHSCKNIKNPFDFYQIVQKQIDTLDPPAVSQDSNKGKKKQIQEIQPASVVAGLFLLAVIIYFIDIGNKSTNKEPNQYDSVNTPPARKWHEDGTLSDATMKEWSKATRANKLATAADLVTKLMIIDGVEEQDIDIEREVLPSAYGMVRGLDTAWSSGEGGNGRLIDNQRVSEVAIAIWVLMKKQ